MTYEILDTRCGKKYRYHDELQARAVLRIDGMKLCQPRGWPFDEDDVPDCVQPPETRQPNWLFWVFVTVLAVACAVALGWFVSVMRGGN